MEIPLGDRGLSAQQLKEQAIKQKITLNNNVVRYRENAKETDPEEYYAKARKQEVCLELF